MMVVLLGVGLALAGCVSSAGSGPAGTAARQPSIFELIEVGSPADLRAAIGRGGDVNAVNPDGNSALMAACLMQRYDLVPILLEAGADVNARSLVEGRTALMWAVMYCEEPDQVLVLLEAGADATARDKSGKPVLDYARENWRLAGTEVMRQIEEASR